MKILSLCVALTACIISMPSAFAVPPTAPLPAPTSQTFLLQHITPETVITQMHWDPKIANMLPGIGTVQIEAQDKDNSLRAQGSPAVLKTVQEIVRELDIAPRAVSIKLTFFRTAQEIIRDSGINFSLLLVPGQLKNSVVYSVSMDSDAQAAMQALLTAHHAPILAAPQIITTNNTAATITIQDQATGSLSFTGSPRINSDHSITLDMTLPTQNGKTGHLLETIGDGHTLLIVSPADADHQVQILFVTPTIVDRP